MGFKRPMHWHMKNGAMEKQARLQAEETERLAALDSRSQTSAGDDVLEPRTGGRGVERTGRPEKARAQGVVLWVRAKRGFGTIRRDGTNDEVIIHHTAMKRDVFQALRSGDRVEFTTITGTEGLHAVDVVPVPKDSVPKNGVRVIKARRR